METATFSSASPSVRQKNQEAAAESSRLDELIRDLAAHISEASIAPEVAGERVLIDTVVDGARYLVIRMALPTQSIKCLSPREQEIIRMVAKGYSNKTIAGVLNISCWTVGTHLRRTFAKLGVASRAAMIARFMEEHPSWDGWERPKDATPFQVHGSMDRLDAKV